MIRVHLDGTTRVELRAWRHKLPLPRVRDCIELLTLAEAGRPAPNLAAHLGRCDYTVRDLLKALLARRTEAIQLAAPARIPTSIVQDLAKAERAGNVPASRKAKAAAVSVVLDDFDECSFSPTMPGDYRVSLAGQRKSIRFEAPQGAGSKTLPPTGQASGNPPGGLRPVAWTSASTTGN